MIEHYEPDMENFSDVFQMFESKDYRQYIAKVNTSWLSQIRDWSNFTTLTFRDDCGIDWALLKFKELIRILNQEVAGSHYQRKAGHSYFSYVCGIELQQRGTPHFHMVTDKPINYHLLWKTWFYKNGYCKIEPLYEKNEVQNVINYALKYASKEGEALIWINPRFDWKPLIHSLPHWWIEPKHAFETLSQNDGVIGNRVH